MPNYFNLDHCSSWSEKVPNAITNVMDWGSFNTWRGPRPLPRKWSLSYDLLHGNLSHIIPTRILLEILVFFWELEGKRGWVKGKIWDKEGKKFILGSRGRYVSRYLLFFLRTSLAIFHATFLQFSFFFKLIFPLFLIPILPSLPFYLHSNFPFISQRVLENLRLSWKCTPPWLL